MSIRKTWTIAACGLLAMAAWAAAESAPARVVGDFDGVLLTVLQQAEKLGYRGRFEKLAPAIDAAFDLDFMAEKSLGGHWKTLAEADRRRWVPLFREFTIANYAGNFDRFTGQRFEPLGEEPAESATVLVRTRVLNPGGEDVDLSYRLRQAGGRWRIVDVYLKGTVSELALRRSDYSSVLAREGFEALLATIRAKVADLAAGRGKRHV